MYEPKKKPCRSWSSCNFHTCLPILQKHKGAESVLENIDKFAEKISTMQLENDIEVPKTNLCKYTNCFKSNTYESRAQVLDFFHEILIESDHPWTKYQNMTKSDGLGSVTCHNTSLSKIKTEEISKYSCVVLFISYSTRHIYIITTVLQKKSQLLLMVCSLWLDHTISVSKYIVHFYVLWCSVALFEGVKLWYEISNGIFCVSYEGLYLYTVSVCMMRSCTLVCATNLQRREMSDVVNSILCTKCTYCFAPKYSTFSITLSHTRKSLISIYGDRF